ncbi:MAG: hypothetical protein IKQ46_05150 [Bacteroidales bacterium]|jgi:hypothetical protein|nr:hypothetical protein [Bacteroidales bacterium]
MKKVIYLASMILMVAFASCEKDEIGGTATQDVAGEWYVSFDAIFVQEGESDTIYAKDLVEAELLGQERSLIRTFNTSANVADKIYISDMSKYGGGAKGSSNFGPNLGFQVELDIDQVTGAFSTANKDFVTNLEQNYKYDPKKPVEGYPEFGKIKIVNGKITPNGGVQNNGSVADAIEFDIYLDDTYSVLYGVYEKNVGLALDHYHVTGIRYSGLQEND